MYKEGTRFINALPAKKLASSSRTEQTGIVEPRQPPSSSSSSIQQATTVSRNLEVTMDANWWFWNLLLAASPAIFIAVYCQFIVIPQMIQERKQQLLHQNNPDALLLVEQASNLSWAESFQGLLEYLQLVEKKTEDEDEKQDVKRAKVNQNIVPNQKVDTTKATATTTTMTPPSSQTANSDSSKSLVQQQLEQIRQQLEELETKLQEQPTESNSKSQNIQPMSNIRQRYMDQQQFQREQRGISQHQQQLEEDASISPETGWGQKMMRFVQTWWTDYIESLRDDDAQTKSSPTTTDTQRGMSTITEEENTASVNSSRQTTHVVHDSNNNSSSVEQSTVLAPPSTGPRQQQQQPCHITRSITHPRDQESEHPLWTLWHKPTD